MMNAINEILSSYFVWTDDVDNIFGFDHIPHFCIPSLNSSFEKDAITSQYVRRYIENYDKLPYTSSPSLPFGEPALLYSEHFNGFDPAMELVNDKISWENRKNKIILANLNHKGRQILKKNKKNVKAVSSGILKLAEHLNCDPDPNFSVRLGYNWYYSGGTLNAILLDNNYLLLSTRSCTPGVVQVTPLDISEADCVPSENKKLFLRANNNKQAVLETVVKNKFVAVRQKNFATLFTISNGQKLKFKKIHTSCESDDSIVSVAISNVNDGEYCTLSTSHTLKIWSSERKDCEFSHTFKDKYCNESCDHWGYINYFSKNNFIFSTRDCIYLKDKRTDLNADLKCLPIRSDYKCNFISLITRSKLNDNILYVGTKHSLYELDLRRNYTKEWIHMMEYAPMFGVSCPIVEGSEVVVASSQSLNEVCLFESNNKSLPFILPTPNETVLNAKIRSVCLDSVITTRCNLSITGLTCIPFENQISKGMYVFRNTSVGDIFYQKVINEKNLSDASNIDIDVCMDVDKKVLLTWERKCQKAVENVASKSLEVTDVVNKRKTYMILEKNQGKKKLLDLIKQNLVRKDEICCGSWNISKKRLMELEDPLAQCLLEEWDIDDDDEWHKEGKKRSSAFSVEEKTDTNLKIESWISQIPDNNPDLSLPSTSKFTSTPNQNSKHPSKIFPSNSASVSFMPNLLDQNDRFHLDEDQVDDNENLNIVNRSYVLPNLGLNYKKPNNCVINSKLSSGF